MFSPIARAPLARLHSLICVALCLSAALTHSAELRPLGFEEALRSAEQRSARLVAQEAAVGAASEQASRAAELPDPKLRLGSTTSPVSNPDAFSLTRDFMTMRRIGYEQDMPNTEKRQARSQRALREQAVEVATLTAQRAQLRQDTALGWLEDLLRAAKPERVRGAS